MTEEWCGPLQWIENCCCKKALSDEYSDSDGSSGDEPPLFTAEDGWCSSVVAESEDEGKGSDNEEVGSKDVDDEQVVQETIDVSKEERHCNDYVVNDALCGIIDGVGNVNGMNAGELKHGMGEGGESHVKEGDGRHVILSNPGGTQEENIEWAVADDTGVDNEGRCNKLFIGPIIHEETSVGLKKDDQVSVETRDNGRCKENEGPTKNKTKKRKKGAIFMKKKKKAQSKKGEKLPAITQIQLQNYSDSNNYFPEEQHVPSINVSQPSGGVVRNPFGQFQPSTSAASSSSAAASHVESIGDSGIIMGNGRFESEMERVKAKKLWSLATEKLGVTAGEEEDELFIERLRAMEEKAQAAKKKKKGNPKGAK